MCALREVGPEIGPELPRQKQEQNGMIQVIPTSIIIPGYPGRDIPAGISQDKSGYPYLS